METKQRRGIQSVEIASTLLSALASNSRPMTLGDIAKAAGMTAGKAHPYMVSFSNVGFVSQDNTSGKYELGPLALHLGLSKLRQLNPIREAAQAVSELASSAEQTVALSVWGNMGPTIVQLFEPTERLHVNLRAGTVMSLATTATGRLYAAYLPPKVVETLLRTSEKPIGPKGEPISMKQFEEGLAEIRQHGMARTIGQPIPGINAFAAPVFDSTGNIVLAITIMGPANSFDEKWSSGLARQLRDCALRISRQLGFHDGQVA
jgi:DNA-binding IclR family transcriptional regulator